VVTLADAEAPSIFLSELDGTRVRPSSPASVDAGRAGAPEQRTNGNSRTRRATKGKGSRVFAEITLPTVEAVPGLVVDDRGTVGTVIEVTAEAAILSAGTVRLKVALGTDVRVDGRTVTLVAPGSAAAGAEAEKALRAWRSALASQEAVPAYVILKDTELAGIAARDPATLAELAACRGMGQIRLERWGDEILAVLDTARAS
jgi:superfamily II DNA helicase RecQ